MNLLSEMPYELRGRLFIDHSVELSNETKIQHNDVLYVRDTEARYSGRILIADQSFDLSNERERNYGFRFQNNDHYKGVCGRNEWIRSFVKKVSKINHLNPLKATFCLVKEIKNDRVIVESEDKRQFLIQYPSKIISGRVGNVIWGRTNEQYCDFAAYDSHYPMNSIQIK